MPPLNLTVAAAAKITPPAMNYDTASREALVTECQRLKKRGYSGKKKSDLIAMLRGEAPAAPAATAAPAAPPAPAAPEAAPSNIHRLNYIGSKFQLLAWLDDTMRAKTGWTDFRNRRIADLFAGTGIVSAHFRQAGAVVTTNDAELYSSVIAHALTLSAYTPACAEFIAAVVADIAAGQHLASEVGYITRVYSPHGECERMFFTVENARRIDYIRGRIEGAELVPNDAAFLLASLLLSADAVSNVPAVYGCFLHTFKAKAEKALVFAPIHTMSEDGLGAAFSADVLGLGAAIGRHDLVYLDPPYNHRQYSKNYFPLNVIAMTQAEQEALGELKGVTGIPPGCFASDFCKKDGVEKAFRTLVAGLNTEWIFISYSSESLVPREKMLELLGAFGEVSVVERDYKRFKNYEYNEDVAIKEYLFCLRKRIA